LAKSKIAAALVFTSPFIPMLFQGEEFGASSPFQYFTHHDDPELARRVSEGRKNEFKAFGWSPEQVPDPQDQATFQRSKLNWDEIAREPHSLLLEWHKQLIRIRRTHPPLTDGQVEDVDVRFDEKAAWLTVKRGAIQVVCNLSAKRQAISVAEKTAQVELCSDPGHRLIGHSIELPGEAVAILSQNCTAVRQPRTKSQRAHSA
jgi:maltooligosyltrehalose trehalohydrolase